MKKYKQELSEGFKKRDFELIQINADLEELGWWMEETWLIRNTSGISLFINFLTDKLWENGKKRVEGIAVSASEMKSNQDTSHLLLMLDMRKGNFEEKLDEFWQKFEDELSKLS